MGSVRQKSILFGLMGIGLVLVGLLAGILGMMYVDRNRALDRDGDGIVELGAPDSDDQPGTDVSPSPVVNVEGATLNRVFREVSERVTPAVVFIQVEAPLEAMPRDLFHDFDESPHERIPRDRGSRSSVGSGVIVSDDGYIVTNNHVVENASSIRVMLSDHREYTARIIGTDAATDLAVIKLDDVDGLVVARFGNSDELMVGEWVLAVGNPFRLTSTVTAGIVSALGRQVNVIDNSFGIEDFIQTDAAINPGNSGGALVNLRSELVGISTAIATESGSYEGYGFAVPVNMMKRVTEDIVAYGEVRRGYLGVGIEEVDASRAQQLGLEKVGGVYLSDVPHNGAAARAGLRSGDVVVSIEGRTIVAPSDLQRTIARYRPGDQLKVEVYRRGARQQYNVRLLGRDDPAYRTWLADLRRQEAVPAPQDPGTLPENRELAEWGIGLRDLTQRDQQAFRVEQGAYVSYVKNNTTGRQAGLMRDVVVLAVGRTAVQTAEEALRALERYSEQEEAVVIRVRRRDGVVAFYELEVPAES